MVPTRMHRFRITHAGPEELRWLAATLVKGGEPLGTSVALEGPRLKLRW
jgi:hypothetical protein